MSGGSENACVSIKEARKALLDRSWRAFQDI
jgi:hypothetical protein